MGVTIDYERKRVTKMEPPDLVELQLAFYRNCGDAGVTGIERTDTGYSYDFIEGEACDCAGMVVNAMEEVWGPARDHPHKSYVDAYRDYVMCRLGRIPYGWVQWDVRAMDSMFDEWMMPGSFTAARTVHGDLTLENTVVDATGRVRFIDPGRPLVKVRELDLGKLSQSVHGWDREDDHMDPLLTSPPVLVMELTHWIRLLCHQEKWLHRSAWVVDHAPRRIAAIIEEVEGCT